MVAMMKRSILLFALVFMLVGALITFTVCGCRVPKLPFTEGFEDMDTEDKVEEAVQGKQGPMSTTEQEMFDDLFSGKLSDKEVHKLIEDGRLTEKLVEKFLNVLDNMPGGKDGEKDAKQAVKKPMVAEEDLDLEPFTGDAAYARF
jgi:hypothetical protein